MARNIELLYDATSASGAALDTGVLTVDSYDEIFGAYNYSGGTPTACQAFISKDGTATYQAVAAEITPTGPRTLFCWGPGCNGSGGMALPLPRWVRFTVGAITSQTVSLTLWGIKH